MSSIRGNTIFICGYTARTPESAETPRLESGVRGESSVDADDAHDISYIYISHVMDFAYTAQWHKVPSRCRWLRCRHDYPRKILGPKTSSKPSFSQICSTSTVIRLTPRHSERAGRQLTRRAEYHMGSAKCVPPRPDELEGPVAIVHKDTGAVRYAHTSLESGTMILS